MGVKDDVARLRPRGAIMAAQITRTLGSDWSILFHYI